MSDPVREQLLGYLLGALDETEQDSIQEQLERDAKLRHELAELRDKLRPLEATRSEFTPPPRAGVPHLRVGGFGCPVADAAQAG